MPPKYEEKAKARIRKVLKGFQDKGIIKWAEQQGLNESDTRSLVEDVLSNALGYEKLREITREFEVKGHRADFAIKLEGKPRFFIEVKAIGSQLSEKDLFQIQSYSASHNLSWMILTNGRFWKCYHLSSGSPPSVDPVFEVDLLALPEDMSDIAEKLYLLSKEAVWRDKLSDYWEEVKATSPELIAKCLLSEKVLTELKREVYRETKQRITADTLAEVLSTEVVRGSIVEQIPDSLNGVSEVPSPKRQKKKQKLPATCFAYVPDPNKPSTWKLKYRNPDGTVDARRLSAAVASLSGRLPRQAGGDSGEGPPCGQGEFAPSV